MTPTQIPLPADIVKTPAQCNHPVLGTSVVFSCAFPHFLLGWRESGRGHAGRLRRESGTCPTPFTSEHSLRRWGARTHLPGARSPLPKGLPRPSPNDLPNPGATRSLLAFPHLICIVPLLTPLTHIHLELLVPPFLC